MATGDNWVNVRDYGAWGDGKHDDTLAIQTASRAVADGGILHFLQVFMAQVTMTPVTYLLNPRVGLVGIALMTANRARICVGDVLEKILINCRMNMILSLFLP